MRSFCKLFKNLVKQKILLKCSVIKTFVSFVSLIRGIVEVKKFGIQKALSKKNIEENNLNYLPKTKLLSFNDSKDKVTCTLKNNSKTYLKEFDKVFLCCGAISTSSIVMNSLNIQRLRSRLQI